MMAGGQPWAIDVAASFCFAGFLVAGLRLAALARRTADVERRKALVSAFLLYALAVSFGAGLTQRDLWPFSHWPIKSLTPPPETAMERIVGVDARGDEHPIDHRAWQPLGLDELTPWVIYRFPTLTPEAKDRAAAYLLDRAERSRRAARSGQGVGYFDRVLGPLASPSFILHPRIWRGPEAVPAEPFIGIRIYEDSWSIAERRRDPTRFARERLYEFPRP